MVVNETNITYKMVPDTQQPKGLIMASNDIELKAFLRSTKASERGLQ